jgi:hypothetical protein
MNILRRELEKERVVSARLQQELQERHIEWQQVQKDLPQQRQILRHHDELRRELTELRQELERIRRELGDLRQVSQHAISDIRLTVVAPQVEHEGHLRAPGGSDRDSSHSQEEQPHKQGNAGTANGLPFLQVESPHAGYESGSQSEKPDPSDGRSGKKKAEKSSEEDLDGRLSAAA